MAEKLAFARLSPITLTNSGTGDALNVAVQDVLGKLQNGTQYVNYGSGTYTLKNSTGGTISSGSMAATGTTVTTTPATLTIPAGATLTVSLTSTIPQGAPAGQYCDVASASASNGTVANSPATACVEVLNFVAIATEMPDNPDPFKADGVSTTMYASGMAVEPSSNQGVQNNVFVFNYGSTDPRAATAGIFSVATTEVWYDPAPTRDPVTGKITSDYLHGTQLVLNTDYTIHNPAVGTQTITMTPSFVIGVGGVVYVRTTVTAPVGSAKPTPYQSGFLWTGNATQTGVQVTGAAQEPTSVVAP